MIRSFRLFWAAAAPIGTLPAFGDRCENDVRDRVWERREARDIKPERGEVSYKTMKASGHMVS